MGSEPPESGAHTGSTAASSVGERSLERGAIDLADVAGPFDLQSTLESGQSYLWDRADGSMYDQLGAHGGNHWYRTVVPPIDGVSDERIAVRVRQVGGVDDGALEWAATADAVPVLTHLLRLDDDLDAILAAIPDLSIVDRSVDAYPGMRLVRDPPFSCLISFICSAQMRVSRIHGMQRRLAETYGETVTFGEETIDAFPTPTQLAAASEEGLRDLALGYRAPYVERTARMVADGDAHPSEAAALAYEPAREFLTQFVGVGEKVADCVCLFALDHLEAVPLDTWIRSVIADRFPECDRGSYAETSRAIRGRFGGEFAGYAQTYVFHYLRSDGE
ncbi:N-glycosylase/DNA lyase [Halopenitus malekzadehii]|uniref:DNA-(apurinic or apyrimidinic site) lyase n=1 Tax=Halopenitus malekzadehii TaxID=1267564 RepID=A0A1H6JCT7_9EURY|nr:N-glycosylase/DNA lyase [Halopenitus malekzadehii]